MELQAKLLAFMFQANAKERAGRELPIIEAFGHQGARTSIGAKPNIRKHNVRVIMGVLFPTARVNEHSGRQFRGDFGAISRSAAGDFRFDELVDRAFRRSLKCCLNSLAKSWFREGPHHAQAFLRVQDNGDTAVAISLSLTVEFPCVLDEFAAVGGKAVRQRAKILTPHLAAKTQV